VIAPVDRVEVARQSNPDIVYVVVDMHRGGAVVHLVLDSHAGAEIECRFDLPADPSPVHCAAGPVAHGVGALGAVPDLDPGTFGAGHGVQALRDVLLLSADIRPADEEAVWQSVHRDTQVGHHARG